VDKIRILKNIFKKIDTRKKETNILDRRFKVSEFIHIDDNNKNTGLNGIHKVFFENIKKNKLEVGIVVQIKNVDMGVIYKNEGLRFLDFSEFSEHASGLDSNEIIVVIKLRKNKVLLDGISVRLATESEIKNMQIKNLFTIIK
jgi:hypothetical protein